MPRNPVLMPRQHRAVSRICDSKSCGTQGVSENIHLDDRILDGARGETDIRASDPVERPD
jgi:hypothetical protein